MTMSSAIEAIYGRLPPLLQNVACWHYGASEARRRLGKLFYQNLEARLEAERWTLATINAYQDERLCELIRHAYHTVPYYRDLMRSLRLTPRDIRSREDLAKLPVLTKEDVRSNVLLLISETANKRELVSRRTSGTTGKSLQFFVGRATVAAQWAVWWRHRKRFGLDVRSWHANFTGKLVVPPGQNRPPYWRWNGPMCQAVINMHHITPGKITDILSFLNQNRFEYYSGYPSVIHALTVTAMEAGLALESRPRVVVTGAENMLEFQRRDIQTLTGAILTDQYGFSEACGNASHCPEFVYHEDFDFGIIECIDPVSMPDGTVKGKIVCTGFACKEFPFIRYEVGDIGVWDEPNRTCRCGRQSRVLVRIEGRSDDYVVTPEGRRIMRFDYIFKNARNVRESQIVQERLGEITVRLVVRSNYTLQDEREIAHEIRRWISPGLKVVFDYTDAIERETSGKFKAVKSLLKGA
jgi:phenylacetate-CoA ligase